MRRRTGGFIPEVPTYTTAQVVSPENLAIGNRVLIAGEEYVLTEKGITSITLTHSAVVEPRVGKDVSEGLA